jgi:hypothetical protein
MITLDSADVLGHCVICDEIRVENNGKCFYIGVYTAKMLIHSATFPVTLPRLGIAITYMQRPEAFISPKFCIFLPGDDEGKPSIEAELPEDAIKGALENAKNLQAKMPDAKNAFATLHANFNFANLKIAKPGLLKVRIARGQELFRLGTIMIEAAPLPSPQPSA